MKFKVGDLIREKNNYSGIKITKAKVLETDLSDELGYDIKIENLESESHSLLDRFLYTKSKGFELIPNKWAEVAKLFSLEIGEEFDIEGYLLNPCKFVDGFLANKNGVSTTNAFYDIMENPSLIIKKPFKPKSSQKYWFIAPSGLKDSTYWCDATLDCLNLKVGNCFRTIYEAEENKDRIMNEIYGVEE